MYEKLFIGLLMIAVLFFFVFVQLGVQLGAMKRTDIATNPENVCKYIYFFNPTLMVFRNM